MIDFFIALFGGTYYGSKILSERIKTRGVKQQVTNSNIAYSELCKNYGAGIDAWIKYRDYVFSGEHYEEIKARFSKEFEFALGYNWEQVLDLPKPETKHLYSLNVNPKGYDHSTWVYHLCLATRGLMEIEVITNGFMLGGANDKNNTSIRFIQCIENRLNRATKKDFQFVLCADRGQFSANDEKSLFYSRIKIKSQVLCGYLRLW